MTSQNSFDYIGYNRLIDRAMRQVVAGAMYQVMHHGLNGDHHFYMTFQTRHPEVRLPPYLLARYPNEMGIVLQYKFWDLQVSDTEFSVLLKFDGKPEKLRIPYAALLLFVDKGVRFSLRFTPEIPDPSNKDSAPIENESNDHLQKDTNTAGLKADGRAFSLMPRLAANKQTKVKPGPDDVISNFARLVPLNKALRESKDGSSPHKAVNTKDPLNLPSLAGDPTAPEKKQSGMGSEKNVKVFHIDSYRKT